MKKVFIIFLFVLINTSTLIAEVPAYYEEVGYYDDDPDCRPVVDSFLKYFDDELFLGTLSSDWNTGNNDSPYGVDTYDLVFYCGHGDWWEIQMYGSSEVDLTNAGNNSDGGYGLDLEHICLYSCLVVPSSIEVSNWWTPWINEPGGIFDGLHMVCGFRTVATKAYANTIANYIGYHTYNQNNSLFNNWRNGTMTYGSTAPDEDKCCMIFLYDPDDSSRCAHTDVYGGSVCTDHDPSSTYLVGMWKDT
ncbi:MAG: hypothetical protein JXB88_15930 [Spirochaetales bacterium]|nr:hypothetical protein [Spirochaetales bacterium]